jgi:transcriptional regulator with XRE-family HTH domain
MKKTMSKTTESHWGQRLTSALREKRISLRKAAAIAGVPASTADSWSSGRSPSDLKAVKRLCDHLNISFTWLLTGELEVQLSAESDLVFIEPAPLLFDGYLKVKIERIVPKTRDK